VLRSEEFNDASWGKSGGVTITANFDTAPNGLTTADRWVSLGGSFPQISQAITVVSGTTYTASLYVKSDGTAQIAQRILIGGTGVNFTPNNTWQRITVSFTAASTSVNFVIATNSPVAPASSFVIWGAQVETGSVATSYIPTVAATATRNADVISKTAVSELIGQTEGTLYAEVDVSKLLGTVVRGMLTISNNTTSNRIQIGFTGASANTIRVIYSGASTLNYNFAITTTGIYKIAFAYSAASTAFYVNGSLVSASVGNSFSASVGNVYLGSVFDGTLALNDRIRAAALYTTRLSNAQLQSLTTL
jgi:hypothetical protein